MLVAIADREPNAPQLGEAFARELAAADDLVLAARAQRVVQAFDAGDVLALDRVIDLAERALDVQTSDRAGALR